MVCYNCNSGLHLSRDCPMPQRFTRCFECTNVCYNSNSHADWCRNTTFISQLRTQSNNIVRSEVLVQIGFVGVNNVFLLDTGLEQPIRGELFIANENLIVQKQNARIICRTIGPVQTKHLNIYAFDKLIMHAELGGKWVMVNDRYHFNENGNVSYNLANPGSIRRVGGFCLKVQSNDTFTIRLYPWNDAMIEFSAHENGVVFQDPLKEFVRTNG